MKDKYDLNEIASWVENNSDVEIPALQRGLVWKPSQVELLWDSILRGFPIGSFMLSEKDEQKNSYYLMDGQQRFNAIAIGYNKIRKEQSPAILWIDIEPNTDVKTTRAYWVKVTTISHPWGFRNDDDCNKLSAPERRDALEKYKLKGRNIYNDVINLKETWPYCAKCPIPLFIFLNANTNSKEKFVQDVIAGIEKYKEEFSFLKKIEIDKIKEKVEALHEPFKRLKEYQVSVNILSREVISQESDRTSSNSETTTLETLFTRLNTGGTRISQEDLSYSAIKAYWPEIKDLNDELASFYMKPEKLAMFVFRLMQTLDGRDYLANDLSLKQIRLLASDESKKAKIIDFYKSEHLNEVLSIIDKWLGIKEVNDTHTPALFRMQIVSNSPDLYLLLMYLAYKYPNIDTIVIGDGSVDVYSPKVLRATQGMIFHVPIVFYSIDKLIPILKKLKIPVYSTNVKYGSDVKSLSYEDKETFSLIIGNEGNGVNPKYLELSDKFIYIPMNDVVESLNVGVATSIILYEMDKCDE